MDQKGLAAMLTPIQSVGVAPEVNPRITQARKHALKPGADVTKSPKQGYQWLHEKDLCPPKIFLKSRARVAEWSTAPCLWHGQS